MNEEEERGGKDSNDIILEQWDDVRNRGGGVEVDMQMVTITAVARVVDRRVMIKEMERTQVRVKKVMSAKETKKEVQTVVRWW